MAEKKFSEMSEAKRQKYFIDESKLIGRTIKTVRYMTNKEAEENGWFGKCVILVLDDGREIVPQQDDEGNGPGAIVVCGPDSNAGLPVF